MTIAHKARPQSAPARPITCTIGAAITVDDAPRDLIVRMKRELSIANPKHAGARRIGRATWGVPEQLCFVESHGSAVRIPRGALRILRKVAALCGYELRAADQRTLPVERLVCSEVPDLRDYQERAVSALVGRHQGVFVLPAGAGKTRSALGAVARLRTPTLVLVGSLDLAEQWRAEARALLGVEAGLVGGGEEIVASVTVALVQSLARWDVQRLDEFFSRFGMLIIDEAHHVPSSTFADIVHRCPAKYRLGLTATPAREDGLGPLLDWFVGPVLACVSHAELIEAGNLIAPEVRTIETSFAYDYAGPDDYRALIDALWQDAARNALIVDATAKEAAGGHSVLVLTGRVEHARQLAAALVEQGVKASALTGDIGKRARSDALAAMRDGSARVLVATSLADEGLDIPRLSRVVLAFPAKSAGRVEQRLGRIMRPHADKDAAVLIDIVDARVPVLRNQARKRRAVFTQVLGGPG